MFQLPIHSTRIGDPTQCYSTKPCRYRTEHPEEGGMRCGCIGGRPSVCTPPRPLSPELIRYARVCRELEDRERIWAESAYGAWWRCRTREYYLTLEELGAVEASEGGPRAAGHLTAAAAAQQRAVRATQNVRLWLDPEEFDLLWRHHVEGETLRELAGELHVSTATTQRRIVRLDEKARAATVLGMGERG